MNSDRNLLQVRAAKHAALSDPSRLRIVDLLTLGDLSPKEIAVTLGMPSNLVAHHLGVLESVGMVSRSRSEADKRRSYVHLTPSALDGLAPAAVDEAARVLFVCTANSARSQLAAALWARHSPIPSASGGTQPAAHIAPGARDAAQRHDLTLANGTPRHLDDVATDADFIVTVCDSAHETLSPRGHLHWSIPDPVLVGDDAAFDTAYDELERRISGLAPRLTLTH